MKCNSILDAVGGTPLIRLNRVTKDIAAEIYVKADYLNPGGSVKDRIAVSMIDEAERKGLLKPGGTIVEGNVGKYGRGARAGGGGARYKVVFTITDKQSREKIDLLKAFGAEVIVCPTAVEPEDPRSYYSVAKKLGARNSQRLLPESVRESDESRGALSHDRPRDLGRHGRKNHALRVRPGDRRNGQRAPGDF